MFLHLFLIIDRWNFRRHFTTWYEGGLTAPGWEILMVALSSAPRDKYYTVQPSQAKPSHGPPILYLRRTAEQYRRRIKTEEKVVTVGWGMYLNAALTILQKGWFEQKDYGRTYILVRWYAGWSSIFTKHPLQQVDVILFILFYKSSWCKIASAAKNWSNSVTQTAATTFAFFSVFFFLLCIRDSAEKYTAFLCDSN